MIKKQIAFGVVIGIACFSIGFLYGREEGRSLPMTHKNYSENKVIATVGENSINEKELKQRMETLFFINSKKEMSDDEIKAYEESFIDYMTTTEVLYLEGTKNKVKVSDEDIKSRYDQLMLSINQTFGITEDDILNKLKIPKEDIEKSLEKELVATNYIGEISNVTEEEAKKYYESNKDEFLTIRASHILVENPTETSNSDESDEVENTTEEIESIKKENKVKAQNILEQAKSGVDFSELAKKYSDDSSSENGGDLGFFTKGQMVEPFEKASFSLKVGQIYDEVVETDFGYHIIKKTDEKYEEFDTIKEDLIYKLSYEKQNKKLDELMEKYDVKVK